MGSNPEEKINYSSTELVLQKTPVVNKLLDALMSIIHNPSRPDITMKHITKSVGKQRKNFKKNTGKKWKIGEKKLLQEFNEVNFALDVIAIFKMSVKKKSKKNKK